MADNQELFVRQLARDGVLTESAMNTDKLIEKSLLPLLWQPAPSIIKKLIDIGYEQQTLRLYRDVFVIWARSSKAMPADPDKTYERYCMLRHKSQDTPLPMPWDWFPTLNCIESISREQGLDPELIIDRLGQFVNWSAGRSSTSWDEEFIRWLRRAGASRTP